MDKFEMYKKKVTFKIFEINKTEKKVCMSLVFNFSSFVCLSVLFYFWAVGAKISYGPKWACRESLATTGIMYHSFSGSSTVVCGLQMTTGCSIFNTCFFEA